MSLRQALKRSEESEAPAAPAAPVEESKKVTPQFRGKTAGKRAAKPKASAKKTKKARTTTKKKATIEDSDEEEEDEEEEEEEEEDEEDEDDYGEVEEEEDLGYGSDLYKDDEDRAHLNDMTEKEREMILTERGEKRDKQKELAMLRTRAKEGQKGGKSARTSSRISKAAKAKKAKAISTKQRIDRIKKAFADSSSDDDSDDSDDSAAAGKRGPTSTATKKSDDDADMSESDDGDEKKTASTRSTRLTRGGRGSIKIDSDDSSDDEEEGGARTRRGGARGGRRGDVSSPSDDDDSGDEGGGGRGRKARGRGGSASEGRDASGDVEEEEKFAGLGDLLRIQVRRQDLIRWQNKPFFRKIIGAYVRLFIGIPEQNRTIKTYRVCEIVDVKECSTYKVDNATLRHALKLRVGKHEKIWKMDKVSNQDIQQSEFDFWVSHFSDKSPRLTADSAMSLFKRRQKEIEGYVLTEKDISDMVERNQRGNTKATNIAMARTKIERFLKSARETKDIEMESKYAAELKEVDSQLEEQKERSKKDSVESVNRRNWNKNIMTLNVISQKEKAHRVGQTQAERNREIAANPYVRRPTRPATLWATRSEESQKRIEVLKEEEETKNKSTPASSSSPAVAPRSPMRRPMSPAKRNGSPKLQASVHSSIDVKLDIANMLAGAELAANGGVVAAAVVKPVQSAAAAAAASRTANRKGMSLGEYWRRQTGA